MSAQITLAERCLFEINKFKTNWQVDDSRLVQGRHFLMTVSLRAAKSAAELASRTRSDASGAAVKIHGSDGGGSRRERARRLLGLLSALKQHLSKRADSRANGRGPLLSHGCCDSLEQSLKYVSPLDGSANLFILLPCTPLQ